MGSRPTAHTGATPTTDRASAGSTVGPGPRGQPNAASLLCGVATGRAAALECPMPPPRTTQSKTRAAGTILRIIHPTPQVLHIATMPALLPHTTACPSLSSIVPHTDEHVERLPRDPLPSPLRHAAGHARGTGQVGSLLGCAACRCLGFPLRRAIHAAWLSWRDQGGYPRAEPQGRLHALILESREHGHHAVKKRQCGRPKRLWACASSTSTLTTVKRPACGSSATAHRWGANAARRRSEHQARAVLRPCRRQR